MAGTQVVANSGPGEPPPAQTSDKQAAVATIVAELQDRTNQLDSSVQQLTDLIKTFAASKRSG